MYACSSSTLQCNVYSYFIILTEQLFRVFFLSHLIRSGDLFAIDLHSSSQGVCLAFELLLENYRPFFSKLFFYTTTFEKKIQRHSYNNHKTIFQNFEIHGSYNMA